VVDAEKSTKTQENFPAANKVLKPLKIIADLRRALREYIFFNTVFVQHLTLSGEPFSVLKGKTLQLKSTAENKSLYTEITLLDASATVQPKQLPQLVISRLTGDALNIELRLIETDSEKVSVTADDIAAKFDLIIRDAALAGSYHINPQRFQAWSQAFINIKGINQTEAVYGTLAVNFSSASQIISTLTVVSDKVNFNAVNADNVVIKLILKTATINPSQELQLLNGSYIKAANFKYDNVSLEDSRINMVGKLTTTGENWLYKGDLTSEIIAARYDAQSLKIKDIAAHISCDSANLNVSGTFSPESVPGKFSFALDHNLAKNHGKLSVNPLNPLDLNAENNKLSQLFTPWPYPFDLLSGKIELNAEAKWSQKNTFSLKTDININDAGGNVGELVFSGLSFAHEIEILPKLQSLRTSNINLSYVDSGVIVSNISTTLAVRTANIGVMPQIVIRDLRGEILGGSFSANDLLYDFNKTKNKFTIKVTNIDLAEIVKTQQLDDITATGRIDGFIPVEINQEGIFIEDGAFINDIRSGTIRYNPATGVDQLKQNPLTGMALDALRDFRYSYLSAGVNFTPDGKLTINLQLKGTSPELDTDRPVHLNINTEQNLLSLLKSLRYAQGISESIDKKVRHQFEKQK